MSGPIKHGHDLWRALQTATTRAEVDGFALAFRWTDTAPTGGQKSLIQKRRAEIEKGKK